MNNFSQMTNAELKNYLAEHRNDDQTFSEALEILIARTANNPVYPPASTMSYEELEAIFKARLKRST